MKIILNIEKRYFWAIISLLIILVGVIAVAAYVNPTTGVGHSIDEVEGAARTTFAQGGTCGTLPSGWSPKDYVCGAEWARKTSSLDTGSGVTVQGSEICLGTNCRSDWPEEVETLVCSYPGHVFGNRAACPSGEVAVSCACGSGCGSWHILDNACICECGEWTQVVCCKIE